MGMEDLDTQLQKSLTELVLSHEFQTLAAQQDVYCPFESLKASRVELRHSNFLADILNPMGTHGFGEKVLRELLDLLFSNSGDHSLRLNISLSDIGRIEILREFHHMDIVVRLPDLQPRLTVILELKVDSQEHGNQLKRYQKEAEILWPGSVLKFFFVTPSGLTPTEPEWTPVGFTELVERLEFIVSNLSGNSSALTMLRAYIEMLRRLFVPNEELESLARKLWQQHGQALDFLVDQKPSIMREVSTAVQSPDSFDAISGQIYAQTGIRIAKESSSNTYLRMFVPAWGSLPDILGADFNTHGHLLVLECEFYGERIHIRMMIGRGNQEHRENLYDRLRNSPKLDLGNSKKLTSQWTRLASTTIKRVKSPDELSEAERDELETTARKGIVSFACKHLPSYQEALQKS